MEYLLGIIIALIGGIFFYKGKSDKAAIGQRIADTKNKDRDLAEEQALIEQARIDLEEGIKLLQVKRKEEIKAKKHMSLKDRRDAARARYKKK